MLLILAILSTITKDIQAVHVLWIEITSKIQFKKIKKKECINDVPCEL